MMFTDIEGSTALWDYPKRKSTLVYLAVMQRSPKDTR